MESHLILCLRLLLAAVLGVAVGAGVEHDAVLATSIVLVALTALRAVEHRFFGRESLSLTLAFAGEPPDAAALVGGPSRHLSRVERTSRPDGSGVLGLSWRGTAADVARVAAAAQALPGVRVEGWEVEQ